MNNTGSLRERKLEYQMKDVNCRNWTHKYSCGGRGRQQLYLSEPGSSSRMNSRTRAAHGPCHRWSELRGRKPWEERADEQICSLPSRLNWNHHSVGAAGGRWQAARSNHLLVQPSVSWWSPPSHYSSPLRWPTKKIMCGEVKNVHKDEQKTTHGNPAQIWWKCILIKPGAQDADMKGLGLFCLKRGWGAIMFRGGWRTTVFRGGFIALRFSWGFSILGGGAACLSFGWSLSTWAY